jgi:endonuclease/exonuclease/phosphatase (EEP) superfamily protein YafD
MSKKFATFIAFATISALLLGSFGRFFWPLDLFAHFRVHYVIALACAGALLIGAREWRSGVLALLGAVLAAIPTFDYLQPIPAPVRAESSLKALSVNVWFRNDDRSELVDYLEASGADLFVLQEVSEAEARSLAATLPSFPFAYTEGAAATDSVLFSRWPIREASIVPLAADGTSALSAIIDWQGTQITVMGVHLHWPIGPRSSARRNQELIGIAALAQAQRGPLLVLGDFNITPWSAHFTQMLDAAHLRDCAVGYGLQPTWPSHMRPIGIRIDHCLASAHWRTLDAWVGPHVGSDHRPMGVQLQLQ